MRFLFFTLLVRRYNHEKNFLFNSCFCFFLLTVGCSGSSSSVSILPPSRVGSSGIQASFENEYTMASALSEADVVARIEVGNWIAEDAELQKTYYEATVLQCFKGSIPTSFTLLQDGCSTGTLKGYPLFTSGNEFLVFLDEATGIDYDSPYWIIGSFMTILDVSYDNSGNRFYADRYGILGETIDIATNYALQEDTFTEVYARSVAADPIVQEMQYSYPFIFAESDLTPLLEGQ